MKTEFQKYLETEIQRQSEVVQGLEKKAYVELIPMNTLIDLMNRISIERRSLATLQKVLKAYKAGDKK